MLNCSHYWRSFNYCLQSFKTYVRPCNFSQIRNQWEVTRIIVQHKLGDCPISEVSVLIAVSSPHRTESLKAVEFAINELKKTVPIWKKVNNYLECINYIKLQVQSNLNLSVYLCRNVFLGNLWWRQFSLERKCRHKSSCGCSDCWYISSLDGSWSADFIAHS